MDYKNKRVLVSGMAKSGISAARLLNNLGAKVILQDIKKREEIKDPDSLEKEGIRLYLGKNPDDMIKAADVVVLSPGVPCDMPFVKKAEDAGIPVISEVELAYSLTPCPLTAITGTNGKTTTTTLVGELMKKMKPGCAVVGNIGVSYSGEIEKMTENDWVVAEISSFQMERAITFHPYISAVLNISPDHLNRHKTMENYIAMKERIFQNQERGDFCILNHNDEICRKMAEKTKARVIFFSSGGRLDEGVYLDGDNIVTRFDHKEEILISVRDLRILGTHNYENVMAAAAMALAAGVPTESIREVLREFKGVEHRIEYVATVDGVDYYNDSKGTNTDAAIRGVMAMNKPVVLIGGGYDKGVSFDDWTKLFPGRVKKLVLIGVTASQIKESAEKFGFNDITLCDTFTEAMEVCRKTAEAGDCVLLSPACASWGMFDNYEQRGEQFKEIVHGFMK